MGWLGWAAFWIPMLGLLARAQGQPQLDVPDGCGSADELRSRLLRLVGEAPAVGAWPERLHIEGRDAGYVLTLEVDDETRVLRDRSCRALFETAVVIVAAAVRPSRLPQASGPGDAAASANAAPAGPSTTEDPQRSPPSAASKGPAWHVGVALGGGVAARVLPRLAPALELTGTLVRDRIGIALSGRYLARVSERVTDEHTIDVWGWNARLSVLFEPLPFLRVQAGPGIGGLTGRGTGRAIRSRSGSGLSVTLASEASVAVLRLGRFGCWLGISGQYAVIRPRFEITGYGEVYRLPRFGAAGMARLSWQLP